MIEPQSIRALDAAPPSVRGSLLGEPSLGTAVDHRDFENGSPFDDAIDQVLRARAQRRRTVK